MKILISNDDGRDAPCLKVLQRELSKDFKPVIVVPDSEKSTSGHGLTLLRPLRFEKAEENFYFVDGLPADCAYLGISLAFPGERPDVMISGINKGGNLGQDVYYSGTVAAAREACFAGIPAISASLMVEFAKDEKGEKIFHDREEDFKLPSLFLHKLISLGVIKYIPERTLLNINFPYPYSCTKENPPKGAQIASLGFRYYANNLEKSLTPRKKEVYWVGGRYNGFDETKGTDCQMIDNQIITVTPIVHGNVHSAWKGQNYPYTAELNFLLNQAYREIYL